MKKLIIADRIAIPVSMVFDNYSSYKGLIVFFASACYGVQVYADFSGGMDIARGFSQIIGIDLILNFNQPYFSSSVEEFWRRWHISLGSFMRDYIFYPLSLSKVFAKIGRKARSLWGNEIGKKIPPFLAMFIVYFLVGLWHGASMKFIIYGIWNGMFIALGILLTDKYAAVKKKCHIDEEAFSWRLFQRIRTFILISIGRIFSRAKDTRSALSMFESMITKHFDFSFLLDGTLRKLGLDTANWIILMVAVVLMLVVDIYHEKGLSVREFIDSQGLVFRIIVTAGAIVAVVILGIYGPGYDSTAFIYQQF